MLLNEEEKDENRNAKDLRHSLGVYLPYEKNNDEEEINEINKVDNNNKNYIKNENTFSKQTDKINKNIKAKSAKDLRHSLGVYLPYEKNNKNSNNTSSNISNSNIKSLQNTSTSKTPANNISYNNKKSLTGLTVYDESTGQTRLLTQEELDDGSKIEFFKAGAFEDGYQFGDVVKTLIGSLADIAVSILGGIISLPESIIDVGANLLATGQDLLGFDEAAADVREFANIDWSEEFINSIADVTHYEDVSVFGETTDDIFKTIGYVGSMMLGGSALGAIGKTASIGSSSLGASANLGNISLKLAGHTLSLPTLSFFGGASSKLAEANAKGNSVTELERWGSATSGGIIEMITEGIFGLFGFGGSDITDDLVESLTGHIGSKWGKIALKTGIQATGEGIEEVLSYTGNYISDNFIIDKLGPTDFSSKWNWKDAAEQFGLAFASSLIMSGGGNVIQSNTAIKSAEKQLGRKLSQQEKAVVTQRWIAQEMVSNEVDYFNEENNVKDGSDLNMVIVSKFEDNGNIFGIEATVGKNIENPNPNVNIAPSIVRNKHNGGYNIVDANTGVMLDNSYYKTVEDAQNRFNDKMNNLDNASINSINNKISQIVMSINNKKTEIEQQQNVANNTQVANENVMNSTQTDINNVNVNPSNANPINENSSNVNTNIYTNVNTNNTYQSSENEFTDEINNNTQNYISNNVNTVRSQNNGLNEVSKLITQISDNSIYGRERTNQVFKTVTRNIPSIEIQVNDNGTYLNSLDQNGNVVYQQEIPNRMMSGGEIKDIVNNAVYNADLSGINTVQTNENQFRGVSNNETVNYASQNTNENVGQNNKQYNLSDEEIRNIVMYNQDGREIKDKNYVNFLVGRYKDNKNISGVVTDTKYVESIKDKVKKDKITDLYQRITDKEFKVTKKLTDENGNMQSIDLDLLITKSGLNESFNKGFSDEKYAIVPYLDQIIKSSPEGTIRAETKQRDNIKEWYYLYNTAEINGELYGVKIDIKKTGQGDRFYVHRVNLIKKEGSSNLMRTPLEMEKSLNTLPSTNTSISQNNSSVKNNTNATNKSMQNNKNNSLKTINSLNDIKTKYKNQTDQLNIFENKDNTISINNLVVKQNLRNKGIGQSILNDIMDYADKTNKTITLTPTSEYLTKNKLINWYKRNGFVENKGKNTDFSISDTMYKLPKNIMQNNQKSNDNGIRAERTSKKNIIDNLMNNIIENEKDNFRSNIKIKTSVVDETSSIPLNYNKVGQSTLSNIAKKLFNEIHKRVLNNNSEKIYVTNSDINESIAQTLKNSNQKVLLKENISVFSQLDKIVENAKEIKSSDISIADNKGRSQYSDYKYYYTNVYIDGEKAWVQFDTRVQKGTTGKSERHFRLERIYKINEADSNGGTDNSITHFSNESTSTKSISQNKQNVKNNGIRAERISNTRRERTNTTNQQYNSTEEQDQDFANYLEKNEYMKTLFEVDNSQGETYAHSPERLIEQEIRKLEETNGFDSSIPVTKLTDIDREIENYLGKTIGKGHFRQRARGIYNSETDKISVKEYKDMDNVFHELGHALDLGGRIKVDKASLSDELLAAIKRHGGYENETIGVQLDEGFAEVLKTYAINKDIVKQDYPKSYKVLEDFKVSNVEFGKFITKLQRETYNYIHQTPRNRGLSNQSIGEQTDKETITIEKIARKAVKTVYDSNYEVKRMQEEFSKATGHKPTPSQNAYLLTRLASGVDNKIISMLSKGYIDESGKRLMPGLNRIGKILGNNSERINDLRAYLAAKRDLEYKAKSLKTGLRTMDSKKIIEQFYNDTQIQEAAQVVYDTLDGVLQYAVNNGLITEENAKTLKESNIFYVPFQRVIEGKGNNVGRRGAVSDIIKQRTGSELDIKDVLENIVTNSANIIKQVENNTILRAVYEQGEQTGMKNNVFDVIPTPMKKIGTAQLSTWESELKKQGIDTSKLDLTKTLDMFVPNNNIITENDGSHIVSFFDKNGNRKYLQFYKESTDIFNSLMGLDKNANSMFLKIMRKMNMPLRYGATMANVGFAIPNMISDTIQASIFSEAGFIPVVDNVLGVLDVLGATNNTVRNFLNQVAPQYAERINRLYDIYQQTGATSSMRMAQYRESAQEIMQNIYGTKNSEALGIKESFKPLKRLMDILTYIPELSESSTRFRVFERNYNAYINKGMSETDARIQAAIESRDATQDFGRTGTLTREINQLIPFSAARVGGAYTFAERVKANPKRVMARTAILLTVAMLIKAVGYDDDEIEELNQRKKDDNFVFKIGDTVTTIKKPQGILRSMINLVEYVQDLATGHIEEGKEGERLVEWTTNAIMDNMPADSITGLVPNAIAPVVENAINKDFYYNTDIVKSWDLNLPDEQQYYDYTSQLAIWLGQVFNYSPAKIDNLISGYLGGLGTQLTNTIDWISGSIGFSAEEPAMGAEDNAIGKRFVVNVNENSASVDEIYSREEELTKKLNGGTITEKENAELENIKAGISKLSALNKQIKAIKQDLTMSGEEKAEAIRPLQEQKTDVARQALGKNPIYIENTDDLEALEFYPSRSTLSYNGLTLNLTEDMKTEYMNTAYELYKKYQNQGLYSDEYLETLKSKVKDAAKKQMISKYKNQLVRGN